MKLNIKSLIAPVLAAVFAASFSQAAIWQWSKSASSNATADASINWSEGQSPSSVNDSARAIMARVAEWRDDLSGLLTTGGTSTVYTVTTNQGLTSTPNDGQALAITVHADSGVSPTLTADAGTAYPIQSSPGVAIGAGTLVNGVPYTVKFSNSNSAWMLHGFYGNPFVIPLGAMIDYVGSTSPNSNFVLPSGQCISRTTYASFFALVSTRYGACDGTTTFAAPDFRGTIAVGKDNMNGSARGLVTTAGSSCDGTTLGTQCGAQTVTIGQSNIPNYTLPNTLGIAPLTALQWPGTSGGSIAVATNSAALGTFISMPSLTGSVTSGGSGTALPMLPPVQIVTKLLRIF